MLNLIKKNWLFSRQFLGGLLCLSIITVFLLNCCLSAPNQSSHTSQVKTHSKVVTSSFISSNHCENHNQTILCQKHSSAKLTSSQLTNIPFQKQFVLFVFQHVLDLEIQTKGQPSFIPKDSSLIHPYQNSLVAQKVAFLC
ncbi:MAG: hypothetical protein ACI86H_001990 [bacterium]|jgi:hypothetical protein